MIRSSVNRRASVNFAREKLEIVRRRESARSRVYLERREIANDVTRAREEWRGEEARWKRAYIMQRSQALRNALSPVRDGGKSPCVTSVISTGEFCAARSPFIASCQNVANAFERVPRFVGALIMPESSDPYLQTDSILNCRALNGSLQKYSRRCAASGTVNTTRPINCYISATTCVWRWWPILEFR